MDDTKPVRPPRDLEAMRLDYEDKKLPVNKICEHHHLARRTFYSIANELGWKLRNPKRVDKHDLVQRLLRLLGAQVTKLENTMGTSDKDESAILNKLVTTLDRLISMKNTEARQKPRRSSKAMTEIRTKVAERLATLRDQ